MIRILLLLRKLYRQPTHAPAPACVFTLFIARVRRRGGVHPNALSDTLSEGARCGARAVGCAEKGRKKKSRERKKKNGQGDIPSGKYSCHDEGPSRCPQIDAIPFLDKRESAQWRNSFPSLPAHNRLSRACAENISKKTLSHMTSSVSLFPAFPRATAVIRWRRRQRQRSVTHASASAAVVVTNDALLVKKDSEPSVMKDAMGGSLEFLSFEGATTLSTWPEGSSRRVRVWLPPRYGVDPAPKGGYPTFILCDGQNLFDDELSFAPQSWHGDHHTYKNIVLQVLLVVPGTRDMIIKSSITTNFLPG